MAVILIKAQDNDPSIPLESRWLRGDVVDVRDWDVNPSAPSGSMEGPPNFELVKVDGVPADDLKLAICGSWRTEDRLRRRARWRFNFATESLHDKGDGQVVPASEVRERYLLMKQKARFLRETGEQA